MRLIIIIAILYLGYRAVKRWISLIAPEVRRPMAGPGKSQQISDILVKDPVCETYIARKDSVTLRVNSQTLYFCSDRCRDQFAADKSGS